MRPLSLDDVLPLEEYAGRRAELFREHVRYVDRCRRVRVGPELTVIFENRQTLWFKVQELLRVARLEDPEWVERELVWYNRLLPSQMRLQAALLIALPEGDAGRELMRFWRDFDGQALRLLAEGVTLPAWVVTQRAQDRLAGNAHWVEFALSEEGRAALRDAGRDARLTVDYKGYRHRSVPLGPDLRRSLLEDLGEIDFPGG